MTPSCNASFDNHEAIVPFCDEATSLAGIIAIHSTALGPAAGGCRLARYTDPDAALTDALRLSQGMSLKNAMAGLPAGGGKAVLYDFHSDASREAIFEAFGDAVERLGGRYITAEDVGTRVQDMEIVARRTHHVAGLPAKLGVPGGDPGPWTALGVYVALEAIAGRPLAGARIAVQGLGSVGFQLCERLHAAGARLVVADVDAERTARAKIMFDAEVLNIDVIHAAEADVFSPNALGASLNSMTIPQLGAPAVCGAANNQLAASSDGEALWMRGITYAPDYVVNAGGIINVMAEHLKLAAHTVEPRVRAIGPRVRDLLARSQSERRPMHLIADEIARARIAQPAVEAVL
jgi:leucine dehydrogenase